MKILKRSTFVSIVLIVSSYQYLSAQSPGDIRLKTGDSITRSIEEEMAHANLMGFSVSVFENYELKWAESWGIKEVNTNEMIDRETAFSTASISKPITATLMVMLESEGKIDLDKPANQYLKRWQIPDNEFTDSVQITLRHLLSHSAGLNQHGFIDFYEGDQVPTLVEVLEGGDLPGTEPIEVSAVPGTTWRYSGGGYVIAMMAMEDHLGRSIQSLAKEYLFDPLEMKHSTFIQPGEEGFLTNVAKVHNRFGEVISAGLPICPQLSASGLWSTPTDMCKLLIELLKAIDGQPTTVISHEVAKTLSTRGLGSFGLGWAMFERYGNVDWIAHGGANTGVGGHILGTLEGGNGMAIFGNGPNGIRIPIITKYINGVVDAFGWEKELIIENEMDLDVAFIERITGKYKRSFDEYLTIFEKEGRLYVRSNWSESSHQLYRIGVNRLLDHQYAEELEWSSEGSETILSVSRNIEPSSIQKLPLMDDDEMLTMDLLMDRKFEEALEMYQSVVNENPEEDAVGEHHINNMGYRALLLGLVQLAIDLFTINTLLYPESANTFDSLGEGYYEAKSYEQAKINYEKSLAMKPNNSNANDMLNRINKHLEHQ